jgi:hypothetical protein
MVKSGGFVVNAHQRPAAVLVVFARAPYNESFTKLAR